MSSNFFRLRFNEILICFKQVQNDLAFHKPWDFGSCKVCNTLFFIYQMSSTFALEDLKKYLTLLISVFHCLFLGSGSIIVLVSFFLSLFWFYYFSINQLWMKMNHFFLCIKYLFFNFFYVLKFV